MASAARFAEWRDDRSDDAAAGSWHDAEQDGAQNGDAGFSISALAAEFGVTTRTIRFYEGEALITPVRRGTVRWYSRADRARLAWILRGRNVGFTLAEIRELLDLYQPGKARAGQISATIARCQARIAVLIAQRGDIDATIAELASFADTLKTRLED
jgi:DNA-binding transcriptional MerR regulator